MSKRKICFIAQFPPPIHGLSKAVETLFNSELKNFFSFEKVDIKNNPEFLKNIFRIARSKADLFYFTISQSRGGNLRDLIILSLIRLKGKKCLIHLHGGYYRNLVEEDLPAWQRRMNYSAINKLDGAIVLGPSLKWIFEGMLPTEKIYTVPNCIDDEFLINDNEFDEKLKKIDLQGERHVLYLSNFIKSKGYLKVLEIAKLINVNNQKRNIHFDFAGKFFSPEEQRRFFEYIENNRLEKIVTYHGTVDGSKKRELLKQCEFFILLTNYPKEGQPISIIEAMANGAAIITTNHAGIPDLVSDGVEGCVIDKNCKNMAEQACSFILNNLDSKKYQIASREKALKFFNQKKYVDNMKDCFCNVLGINILV